MEARAVITADVRVIDGETKNLKEEIVKALRNGDTSVETVLVANRSDPSSLEEVYEDSSNVMIFTGNIALNLCTCL